LDHITDPQNVGNLLRTCEVLGGTGALLPKDRSAPLNETVVKASSGAVFYLTLAKVSSLQNALREWKKVGGWVVSVEKGGKDIREVEIPLPAALVLGAEDKGVSESLLKLSDLVVTIPMKGRVTSLNVGSAGAIAMWETGFSSWRACALWASSPSLSPPRGEAPRSFLPLGSRRVWVG